MLTTIPEADIQKASVNSISVGSVGIGPVTIGQLVITDLELNTAADGAFMRNFVVTVTYNMKLDWHLHIGLPASQIPDIVAQGVDSTATPKPKAFHLDMGCLDLVLKVNPTAQAHMDEFIIRNVKASGSIGKIELHNVVAPYELLNVTLSQL